MFTDVELFEFDFRGLECPELEARFPLYPLDGPGMPLPGFGFLAEAGRLGDTVTEFEGTGKNRRLVKAGHQLKYLYRRALYDNQFMMPFSHKGNEVVVRLVPGHIWGDNVDNFGAGPRQADVLLLGKMPGREEIEFGRNFVGPTSGVLVEALEKVEVHFPIRKDWYITNLSKVPKLDQNSDTLPKPIVQDCRMLLQQELRFVQPKFILCLGSEASKDLLGAAYSVTNMTGRVVDYSFPINLAGEPETLHTAKVMTVTHPAAVYRTPELMDSFEAQLALFWQLINGAKIGEEEKDIDHRVYYHEHSLKRLVDKILADPDPESRIIAVDAEWHGDRPQEPGAYLRTIQFSWADKKAICVVLRHQGGATAFQPNIEAAVTQLRRLLKSTPERRVSIGGHFFRADLPWLIHAGLDLRDEYKIDLDDPRAGGWDTGLEYHSYNETARLKLEEAAIRLTTAPRYDVGLQAWRRQYCLDNKLKAEDLEGYGDCPGETLHPVSTYNPNYACYDPDVTRRIHKKLILPGGPLDADWNGNNCWRPYKINHLASPAFLEMETTGILIDRNRADKLTMTFLRRADRLLAELREDFAWPLFNPRSHPQCQAALFGAQYGCKKDPVTQLPKSILPAGSKTFTLTPVKTTGKRAVAWEDVVKRRETHLHTPSTDKETLGILGYGNPVVAKLRDYKFISQVLTSVLRRPNMTDSGYAHDEDGNLLYEKGLVASVQSDGRVHTHLTTTKETGRASSFRPGIHNISKRREDDYKRILGDDYEHPIRSVFIAPPGSVLIEADLQGAELAVLAWSAQDHKMMDHVRRGMLPEDHPDYYDMHSRAAVESFNLSCPPTKKGIKSIGRSGLRVAAKNVVFGSNYGRQPPAIARQCAEEGVDVSVNDVALLQDRYFERYPQIGPYMEECKERSQDPGWICSPYGRYRRFMRTNDRQVKGEQERQAMNFVPQSAVADAVYLAVHNLLEYRAQFSPEELDFRILLTIHDAVLLEVPIPFARRVHDEVLPACMCAGVPFWPCDLTGKRLSQITKPYHFGIDREMFSHWGEKLSKAELLALGVDG